MTKIREVLEGLVNHTVKKALGYASNEYADKDITQAEQAILSAVREVVYDAVSKSRCCGEGNSNICVREILERLENEGER